MNKVKELRIDSTLWATPARLVNLLDFKPEKLSIETESNANNDMKFDNIRYENGGFYLTIDNLRGYFNYSNNLGTLTMLFDDINQQNKLFTYYSQLVNILDFNPKKLSLEKVCASNDKLEHIYYVKYDKDPFYLIIDDSKGYFKYSKEKDKKELECIIEDQRKKKLSSNMG